MTPAKEKKILLADCFFTLFSLEGTLAPVVVGREKGFVKALFKTSAGEPHKKYV